MYFIKVTGYIFFYIYVGITKSNIMHCVLCSILVSYAVILSKLLDVIILLLNKDVKIYLFIFHFGNRFLLLPVLELKKSL